MSPDPNPQLISSLILVAAAAPLGCLVLWLRLAFAGDALAHTSLLGIAIGMVFGLPLSVSVFAVCILAAIILGVASQSGRISPEAMLGIISPSALAIAISMMTTKSLGEEEMEHYLFGDIDAVTSADLPVIAAAAAVILLVFIIGWRRMVLMSLHTGLAAAEGLPVLRLRLVVMAMMALFVAVAIKTVGVLLTAALLVLPAASGRMLASNPAAMAIYAAIAGAIAVFAGLAMSASYAIPAGAAIVMVMAGLAAISGLLTLRRS